MKACNGRVRISLSGCRGSVTLLLQSVCIILCMEDEKQDEKKDVKELQNHLPGGKK